MDKKNKLKKLLPVMLMFAASVVIGVTGATVIHQLKLENPVKTPTVEGEIKEELGLNTKKISFVNTGEADVLIRASISETWINEDGSILPNKVLVKAGEGDGKEELTAVAIPCGKVKDDGRKGVITPVSGDGSGDGEEWVYNPEDGWYYYNRVLPGSVSKKNKADRETKALLVSEVKLPIVDEDELKAIGYDKAKYELHCTMEVVQASDDVGLSIKAANALFTKATGLTIPEKWNGNKYTCTINWLGE